MAVKHTCEKWDTFNQIALDKQEMARDIKEIKESQARTEQTLNDFITSANSKFLKKETVQNVFLWIMFLVSFVWIVMSFLAFVVPNLK